MKQLTWFARPPKFLNRMIMMMLGVATQGLGLSLLRQLYLGTDPCSALTLGVIKHVPITFGTAQVLCHLVTFAFVVRFDIGKIGYGTIGNMVFLGYISDFFTWVEGKLLPADFFEPVANRWIMLIPSLAIFLCGAAAYLSADLGASPYDAMPFIIHNGLTKRAVEKQKEASDATAQADSVKPSFKTVRICWDIAFTVGGFILLGGFGTGVGIVTVLVAFFLGPLITWMKKKMEVFL